MIETDGHTEVTMSETDEAVDRMIAGANAWLDAGYTGICPVRDVLDRIGDKWTVLVVLRLGRRKERFRSLLRAVDGISQRMLTVTLRALERDGLVHRQVFDTRPPSVEYSLTPLGRSLLGTIDALARWAVDNEASVNAARVDFDQRNGADT